VVYKLFLPVKFQMDGWVLTGLLFVFSSEHIPLFKTLQLFA